MNISLRESSSKNENILVAVRCRPLNEIEKKIKSLRCVEVDSDKKEIHVTTDKNGIADTPKRFLFDRVFGSASSQRDVYTEVVSPLLSEVLMGYSCTVFAYGQTGTGKTFTMIGEKSPETQYSLDKDPLSGIIPRCINQLFEKLNSSVDISDFTVKVSFLEIYNEELYDLMGDGLESNGQRPRIFDDASKRGSVIISGLEEVMVYEKNQVYAILEKGAEKRQSAATLLNAHSSRSHTVFSVVVNMKETILNGDDVLKTGKIHLVDLAGSENVGRSGAVNRQLREAGNINQSLLTLGRVINALLDKKPHIPYRESKLTRLLQDSLGGRTKTCIIATISPATSNLEETLSTLEYAHRAKRIKNCPTINRKLTQRSLIQEYSENISRLKADLLAARDKNGIYLTQERYDTLNASISTQKEVIGTLEANLLQMKNDFDAMTAMFKSSKENLQKNEAYVKDARSWLSLITNELKDTIDKLNEKNVQIATSNYAIEQYDQVQRTLYIEATALKQDLESAVSQIHSLDSRLRQKMVETEAVIKNSDKFQKELADIVNYFHNEFCNIEKILKSQFEVLQKFHTHIKSDVTSIDKSTKEQFAKFASYRVETTGRFSATLKNLETSSSQIQSTLKEETDQIQKQLHLDLVANFGLDHTNELFNVRDKLVKLNEKMHSHFEQSEKTLEEFKKRMSCENEQMNRNCSQLMDSMDKTANQILTQQHKQSLNQSADHIKTYLTENSANQLKTSLMQEIEKIIDTNLKAKLADIYQHIDSGLIQPSRSMIDQQVSYLAKAKRSLRETVDLQNQLKSEVVDRTTEKIAEQNGDTKRTVDDTLADSNSAIQSIDESCKRFQAQLTEKLTLLNDTFGKGHTSIANNTAEFKQSLEQLFKNINDHIDQFIGTFGDLSAEKTEKIKKETKKLTLQNFEGYNSFNSCLEKQYVSVSNLPEKYDSTMHAYVNSLRDAVLKSPFEPTKLTFRMENTELTVPRNNDSLVDEFKENFNPAEIRTAFSPQKTGQRIIHKLERLDNVSGIIECNLDETIVETIGENNENICATDNQLLQMAGGNTVKRVKSIASTKPIVKKLTTRKTE